MGGDSGPCLTVPAAVNILHRFPELSLTLFGDSESITANLPPRLATVQDRLRISHSSQSVGMAEKPSSALRNKRESSLWHALQSVATGDTSACVSAGNTGAMMVLGIAVLGTLPGIDRPAICTAVPTLSGKTYLLDMGANLECNADQLYQFGQMGSSLVSAVDTIENPVLGLLNVGSENSKGHSVVKAAAALLSADPNLNYQGFVEGDSLYQGGFDVVICDGFVGNVALKCSEGVARMIATLTREALTASLLGKIAALLARPTLKKLQKRIDPARYNGASLLGLDGVVVKSHGGTSQEGFERAIEFAIGVTQRNVPELIKERLSR